MGNNFTRLKFEEVFQVESIITLFYMEIQKEFSYPGEQHNFWEMVYIDKGEMICTAGNNRFSLKSGEITFHKPNEFHNLAGNKIDAPNVSIITFDCSSPLMNDFDGKIFKLDHEEKNILSLLFQEGLSCYEMQEENNPLIQVMNSKKEAPLGSSQATKNLLEFFLILLYRKGSATTKNERKNYMVNGLDVPMQIKNIIDYMKAHVRDHISVSAIAHEIHTSESQTKKLFAKYYDGGLINYFNGLKMHEARKLIREEQMNMAQIAEYLGFDNPQYFTRCFSKYSKMTPTEYKKSIL